MRLPVARDGLRFIIPSVAVAAFGWILLWPLVVKLLLTALALFVLSFFRDPERQTPFGESIVISPADGRIIRLEKVSSGIISKDECFMVSIFMSVFNVHVNRIPLTGRVGEIKYNKGKFISAFKEKASKDNENNAIMIHNGKCTIEFVQIAGLIARRIVCWVKKGDNVVAGNRFGLIRFGSRVDVYLPLNFSPEVAIGQKVKAGETILGGLK